MGPTSSSMGTSAKTRAGNAPHPPGRSNARQIVVGSSFPCRSLQSPLAPGAPQKTSLGNCKGLNSRSRAWLRSLVSISQRLSPPPFSPARCHLSAGMALPEQMASYQTLLNPLGGPVLLLNLQASESLESPGERPRAWHARSRLLLRFHRIFPKRLSSGSPTTPKLTLPSSRRVVSRWLVLVLGHGLVRNFGVTFPDFPFSDSPTEKMLQVDDTQGVRNRPTVGTL